MTGAENYSSAVGWIPPEAKMMAGQFIECGIKCANVRQPIFRLLRIRLSSCNKAFGNFGLNISFQTVFLENLANKKSYVLIEGLCLIFA